MLSHLLLFDLTVNVDLCSAGGAEDDNGVEKAAEDVDTVFLLPLGLRCWLGRKGRAECRG